MGFLDPFKSAVGIIFLVVVIITLAAFAVIFSASVSNSLGLSIEDAAGVIGVALIIVLLEGFVGLALLDL